MQGQANIGGLVYTGIPKTSDDGYGSMGQPLISLSGILDNQAMMAQTRIVWKLLCGQGNGSGMIENVVTVVLTFVKSIVSTTSVMNIYTIDGLKLVLSPEGTKKMFIRGGSFPDFHEKGAPFVYLLLTNGTSFTSV